MTAPKNVALQGQGTTYPRKRM